MKQALREGVFAKWDATLPRERDRWVAEAVFGTTVYPTSGVEGISGEVYDNHTGEVLPRYTEDIAYAWTVLEHNGYIGDVGYRGDEYRAEVWSRWNEEGKGVNEYASGDSAPEAICLAAILAKLLGGAA